MVFLDMPDREVLCTFYVLCSIYIIFVSSADVRGFMTSHGQPDGPRSARYILKDYVNGRLLYSRPPPGVDLALFNQFTSVESSQCDDDDSIGPVTQEAAGTDKVRRY